MKKLIGIGNEFRKDDAAGLIVARGLKGKMPPDWEVAEASGEGTQLMELWKDAGLVILIDALDSGGEPGGIRRFEAHQAALPARSFRYSTHAFSLGEAIELARALGQLPASVIVYGVVGRDFSAGVGLSSETERGTKDLTDLILSDLGEGVST